MINNIADYGFDDSYKLDECEGKYQPARVVALHKEICRVYTGEGEVFGARLKGSFYHNHIEKNEFPVVGDFVYIVPNSSGDASVVEVCPRKSTFSRAERSGHAAGFVKTLKESVIAANIDCVFIMMSLNFDYNVKRCERYIATALGSGIEPVVLLTKADLVSDAERLESERKILAIREGVKVFSISSRTGFGIDTIEKLLLPRKTFAFLGSSGVGKSSLLNYLYGEELMNVRAIREDDSKGRHTTTHRELFMLKSGAMIIDTPGLRELGLWDAEGGVEGLFSDVMKLVGKCKYNDCSHVKEDGCAVKRALSDGTLSPKRWSEYLNLVAENEWTKTHTFTRKEKLREKIAKKK